MLTQVMVVSPKDLVRHTPSGVDSASKRKATFQETGLCGRMRLKESPRGKAQERQHLARSKSQPLTVIRICGYSVSTYRTSLHFPLGLLGFDSTKPIAVFSSMRGIHHGR